MVGVQKVRHAFGDYLCTPGEALVFGRAPRRKDGRFDRRYRDGREAMDLARGIIAREELRHLEALGVSCETTTRELK